MSILPSLYLLLAPSFFGAGQPEWQQLENGLEIAVVHSPKSTGIGDDDITILRADPAEFLVEILMASAGDNKAKTARQWATENDAIAVVNAGMFRMDGLTNVGYMKCGGHLNNAKFNDDNAIAVFGPTKPGLTQAQIIDRECQDWKALVAQYQCATQGIRMIDCKHKNRWSQQPRQWSMVVMGADMSGRLLFIFTRSPHSVHDFIDILLGLDLEIKNAMYLEGGPEASLYVKTKDCEVDKFGSYETGFFESDQNDRAWPIPNVIAIKRKTEKAGSK